MNLWLRQSIDWNRCGREAKLRRWRLGEAASWTKRAKSWEKSLEVVVNENILELRLRRPRPSDSRWVGL